MLVGLVIAVNHIHAAWIALWARLSCALTGGRNEQVSIPGGISILLKFDQNNKLKGFLILRDLRIFPRMGFADSYYVHDFREAREWNELVASVRDGPPSHLPAEFRWHKNGERIVQHIDGEQFSLSTDHVEAIDEVIQAYFPRST